MNARQLELAVRRGELKARCAQQREVLASSVWPVEKALGAADAVVAGVDWLKRRPGLVGAAVALAVILRPGRAWRWGRRGFTLWGAWKALQKKLFG